jgi:hypothetical protein
MKAEFIKDETGWIWFYYSRGGLTDRMKALNHVIAPNDEEIKTLKKK